MEHMRVGVSIIKQLSTAFYGRKTMVLEELVANSYDASASYAKITTDSDSITILDDGEGMSPEELTKFFYISYTEKNKKQIKEIRDKLKRYIIGKFGIGKLSMYQLCRKFSITSWKEGIESVSTFDFDAFEKREFVDEIELNVSSVKADPKKHGTEIKMEKLRPGIEMNAVLLRRSLSNRMFLNPDFKIFVNDLPIASVQELPFLAKYPIDEDLPQVGRVHGEIKFLTHVMDTDEAGIYVRVRGRVINHDPRIVDFARFTSPNVTGRRIWGILDVDGLEDAIQSNRSDFVKDHHKYKIFIDWLYDLLLALTPKFMKTDYHDMRTKQERDTIPRAMQKDFGERMEQFAKKIETSKKEKGDSTKNKSVPKIDLKKLIKKFDLENLGVEGPTAKYDEERNAVIINTEHPMYKQARKRRCLEYHVMIASIIIVATKTSSDLNEFLEKYESLINIGEIPPKFKRGISQK